jgi:hypothetical protein
VNRPLKADQWAREPSATRLPITFIYPIAEIVLRCAVGLALFALGMASVLQPSTIWLVIGIAMAVFGGLIAASNLLALLDRDWRRIVVNRDGVDIRYGFSHRYYRFVDYSEYRISRIGLRRFLAALPLDVDRSLGEYADEVRITIFDRPAFIMPVPLFEKDGSAILKEWQTLLNTLRRAALISAGMVQA